MNKVRELKIDSTLWATPSKIINLLDFKPEKLSIETKSNSNNDVKCHHVRYKNGGFYLTIDDIRGYFNFSNNNRILTMIFANDEQQNKIKIKISIKIKDPLFTYYAQSVNILDFNLEKLSIEKVHAINDELERIYYVKYNNNPFYLVINNLKGYFKYSKEKDRKELEFIIEDQSQRKIYDQIWDKIK